VTLDKYLERFIEGHLFEDLRAMATIRAHNEKGTAASVVRASAANVVDVLEPRFRPRHDRL